jgi:hypothetical protein
MLRSAILSSRNRRMLLGALAAGTALTAAALYASDHQDTPEVELSPRMDINDVYAFPGASADRIVLVMTTSSPITPAQSASASFDPNLLYQLKIDNTGDGVEDRVLQFTFRGTGTNQQVQVRGPVAPASLGMINTLVAANPALTGSVNTNLGSTSGMQVFTGLRDDPFFIDLEQFFRIIPDRKPATGRRSRKRRARARGDQPARPWTICAGSTRLQSSSNSPLPCSPPAARRRSVCGARSAVRHIHRHPGLSI